MTPEIQSQLGPEVQSALSGALGEQKSSWEHGQRISVEEILERAPRLRENPDAVLDLIYQEVVLRRRWVKIRSSEGSKIASRL